MAPSAPTGLKQPRIPLVNDAFAELHPYVPGKPVFETLREYNLTSCIKLASNENCYGASPKALQAMTEALQELHADPDANATLLRAGLAQFLGCSVDQLIVGNGTNEILEMVARTCLRPGEQLLFAAPSFVAYKLVAQAMGAPIVEVPLRDMRFDLEALLGATTQRTKLLFIANPNNPTGTYVGKEALQAFLQTLPEHVLVVLDEAYFEYATAADYPDGMQLLHCRERLLVSRTFSKAYGLAGARVGFAVGQPSLIDMLNRGRQPFNVNSLAQAGALAALGDPAHVQRSVQHNTVQRQRLGEALRARGLQVVDSQANFLLTNFLRPAAQVYTALLQRGIIVRPMQGYGLPSWQRITVGTAAENEALLGAIDAAGLQAPAA